MNKRGAVLMVTMWILAILVIVAVGLGHRAAITLRLARYQKERLKAYYLARAGVNKAILMLREDAGNVTTNDYDTLQECGVAIDNRELKDIFSQEWPDTNTSFSVGYIGADREFIFGLRDEESKININAADDFGRHQISVLLAANDIEYAPELADTIADWTKPDAVTGIELVKKETLKIPEELLAVLEYFYQEKGMDDYKRKARETFDKIKDYITTFGNGRINLNTASSEALEILFNACVKDMEAKGEPDLPGPQDIEQLLKAINNYRNVGGYFVDSKMDAESIKTELGLSGEITNQSRIVERLSSFKVLTAVSQNYRIESIGKASNVNKKIVAVYRRDADPKNQGIVYWHEN